MRRNPVFVKRRGVSKMSELCLLAVVVLDIVVLAVCVLWLWRDD